MEKPSKTLKQLLGAKPEVFSITPEATVFSALQVLAEKNVGALVVLEGDRLVGIVSGRDYVRKVELHGKTAKGTRVREIMTEKVISVTLGHTVEQCIALMKTHRMRHLPVVEGHRVIGVLSNRVILEAFIAEEEHLIHDLERERLTILNPDPSSY